LQDDFLLVYYALKEEKAKLDVSPGRKATDLALRAEAKSGNESQKGR
jgi:hypothetical protein